MLLTFFIFYVSLISYSKFKEKTMNLKSFLDLLSRRKQTILAIVMVFLAISVVLVVAQTFKYGSSSRLLISQSFSPNTDAYNISRTNDYLGNLFAQVVGSNSFYNDVLDSGFNIDEEYFAREKNFAQLMEKWEKTVEVDPLRDGSGIIEVNVFHPDKEQVSQISQAVNYVINTQNQSYHGLGDQVFVRVIDRPIISAYPVKPNIFLIFPLALLLGLAVSFLYVYLLPEEKYALKIAPGRKKKGKNQPASDNFPSEKLNREEAEDWSNIKDILEQKNKDFNYSRRYWEGESEETRTPEVEPQASPLETQAPEPEKESYSPKTDKETEDKTGAEKEAGEPAGFAQTEQTQEAEKAPEDQGSSVPSAGEPKGEQAQEEIDKILDSEEIEKQGDMRNIF